MKGLIVHNEPKQYNDGCFTDYQELWVFEDEVDLSDLNIHWKQVKKDYPVTKLYEYLESLGGELIEFETLLI